jgi:hypothetical protein
VNRGYGALQLFDLVRIDIDTNDAVADIGHGSGLD